MLPIYNNRELLGYAKSINHAKKIIKGKVYIHKAMALSVLVRDKSTCDILGLPQGFVYSISYKY